MGGFIKNRTGPDGQDMQAQPDPQFVREQEEIRRFRPPDEKSIKTQRRAMEVCYWAVQHGEHDPKAIKAHIKQVYRVAPKTVFELVELWLDRKGWRWDY
jgi:hypothetical protein